MVHCITLAAFATLTGTALAARGRFMANVPFDGPNPSNVRMFLYEPPTVIKNAPLLVAPHWCNGSAPQAFGYYGFQDLADEYGFPVVYPDTPHDSHCWDVTSQPTNKHNAGGDSQGIVSMTKHVMNKYKCDPTRVFVSGFSSGAMMTQVLLSAYPEVYAAGSAVSGVPFGCCVDPNGLPAQYCPVCAEGNITRSGEEWAQIVKDASPKYDGYRPKLQLMHGTADPILFFHNFKEEVKQWTSVFGISTKPVETKESTPEKDWTKSVYEDGKFETYVVDGAGHGVPFKKEIIAEFFELSCRSTNAKCFSRPAL